MIVASFQHYLPLSDLARIVAVGAGVAVIAPTAAALVITGFEARDDAHHANRTRVTGDLRIALGIMIIVVLVFVGIYALIDG